MSVWHEIAASLRALVHSPPVPRDGLDRSPLQARISSVGMALRAATLIEYLLIVVFISATWTAAMPALEAGIQL
jgi:hypothetical protein